MPRMLPALFLHGGCQHHNHKRGSFILLVLLPSHALAGLGLWWDRGNLSFLWTLLAHPFSLLTPRTPRVLCTMSDRAMYTECGCLGVSTMLLTTWAVIEKLPQMEPASLYLTDSPKTLSMLPLNP